jgi:DNA-binding transcriptional regulator YiaG
MTTTGIVIVVTGAVCGLPAAALLLFWRGMRVKYRWRRMRLMAERQAVLASLAAFTRDNLPFDEHWDMLAQDSRNGLSRSTIAEHLVARFPDAARLHTGNHVNLEELCRAAGAMITRAKVRQLADDLSRPSGEVEIEELEVEEAGAITMTAAELRAYRRAADLSRRELAAVLGVASARTVQRWEAGTLALPEIVALGLRRLPSHRHTAGRDREGRNQVVDRVRYLFPDGSAIVEVGLEWNVEGPIPYSLRAD